MVRHITVVPASTKAGKAAIQSLLSSEDVPLIRGIYRDVAKAPAEFTQRPKFEAKSGDVSTGLGLDFSESEAVFYIPPPIYDGTDIEEFATRAANNMKKALQEAPSVQKLLLFSSMGAQYDHGIVSAFILIEISASETHTWYRVFSKSTTSPTHF